MLTSNALPMIGTLTIDRWGARFHRQDRPATVLWAKAQRKTAATYEAERFAADLADDTLAATAYDLALLALSDDETYYDWAGAIDTIDEPFAFAGDDTEADYDTAADLPGAPTWGTHFDPADLQWGFTVRTR